MQVYKLLYMVKIILMENETNENKTKTKACQQCQTQSIVPTLVPEKWIHKRMINHFKYTVQLKRSVQFYSSWHEDEEWTTFNYSHEPVLAFWQTVIVIGLVTNRC